MRITQEADYALRAIYYLSTLDAGARASANVIAKEQNIPLRFLLKLLQKLRDAGLVESFMGVNGGYALSKQPKDISFLDVIEAIDGPIYINRCLYDPEECNNLGVEYCSIHKALHQVQEKLKKDLSSINFQHILDENGSKEV
ncbi:MAG: Rrf2 family transcriptional regulator [Tissierellia bacterium]|nr:Rrf2 family transcriptional regulator [Tissierellia bacterium]